MRAEYLLRLDDACPTMDRRRWDFVTDLALRHDIKPIVGVVPANADPDLARETADEKFWDRMRASADAGWMIAMHGYRHALRPSRRGIVPLNRSSEFVGLPADEQGDMIRKGIRELRARGLEAEAWMAPAHGMDLLTLEALRSESRIRIISDSFTRRPVLRWGFTWIPQQLWRPRGMPSGLWTICLHPNAMNEDEMGNLARFLETHAKEFADPREAASRALPYGLEDMLFESAFLTLVRMRRRMARGKV